MSALRVFEVAGRRLSMTATARELAVTHGAVSRQIRNLEQLLGLQLFERVQGRLRLTPQGQMMHQRVREAFDVLADATFFADRESLAEVLHIASTRTIAHAILIPNLAQFRYSYPDLDIVVHELAPEVTDIPGMIDVAFCYNEPTPYRHTVKKLCDVQLFPVCTPSYLNRIGPIHHPTDLRSADLLHDDDGGNWRNWLSLATADIERSSRNVFYFAPTLTLSAARFGQGIALSQLVEVASDLEAGVLVRLFKNIELNRGGYYMAVRQIDPLPRRIRVFEQWARDVCFRFAQA